MPTATVPSAGPTPRTARFAPTWRARGHRRLVGALVAAGDTAGGPGRLVLTAERVAIATVTYRSFDSDFSAVSTGHGGVSDALKAAASAVGIRGRCDFTLAVPAGRDSGADLEQAAAYAATDALYTATEVPFTVDLRAQLSAALKEPVAAPAEDGFGVHDDRTGLLLTPYENAPRFYLVLAHRPGSTTADLTGVGTLPTSPIPAGEAAAAAWLERANGPMDDRLADLVATVRTREPFVLGAVGGHRLEDPVAFLLPGSHATLVSAQTAFRTISGLVAAADPGRRVTLIRQGRVA